MDAEESAVQVMLAQVRKRGGTFSASYVGIVGLIISALRLKRQWSQNRLSKESEISQPTISRIEMGEGAITVEQMDAIARVLGVLPSTITQIADRIRSALESQDISVPTREYEELGKPNEGRRVYRAVGPELQGPLGGFFGAVVGGMMDK